MQTTTHLCNFFPHICSIYSGTTKADIVPFQNNCNTLTSSLHYLGFNENTVQYTFFIAYSLRFAGYICNIEDGSRKHSPVFVWI